ncbi:MAG: hypothetical protein Q9228_005727 [Teloschistes exilis]
MLGFSDVPITIPTDAPSFYGCIEAKHVTTYLEDYIDNHIYNGSSLRSRKCFGRNVETVKKVEVYWVVSTQNLHGEWKTFKASKLVVAAGLTSLPRMPFFAHGQNPFKGPIRHHKHFGQISSTGVLSDPRCKHVAVVGAGKFATDMVYESVKKGKHVSWIIRKDGEGPTIFFTAPGGGRYKNSTEAGATRMSASFSPSSFMQYGLLASLIHRTSFGVHYMKSKILQDDKSCRDAAAYHDRPGALPRFKNLGTATSAFWCNGPLRLAQYNDFWDTLAQNVDVYRNNVVSLTPDGIVLDDRTEVAADILLCGTGWSSNYPFFSKHLACSQGLPHSPEDDSPQDARLWDRLSRVAEQEVLSKFPILKHLPLYKNLRFPQRP